MCVENRPEDTGRLRDAPKKRNRATYTRMVTASCWVTRCCLLTPYAPVAGKTTLPLEHVALGVCDNCPESKGREPGLSTTGQAGWVIFPRIVFYWGVFLRDFVPNRGIFGGWRAGGTMAGVKKSEKLGTAWLTCKRPGQADPAGGCASPTFRRDACRVRSEIWKGGFHGFVTHSESRAPTETGPPVLRRCGRVPEPVPRCDSL